MVKDNQSFDFRVSICARFAEQSSARQASAHRPHLSEQSTRRSYKPGNRVERPTPFPLEAIPKSAKSTGHAFPKSRLPRRRENYNLSCMLYDISGTLCMPSLKNLCDRGSCLDCDGARCEALDFSQRG